MLKFKTSYFAMVRHFREDEIPISTAVYDKPWFHTPGTRKGVFLDKRNVINGLRAEPFAPICQECEGPHKCLWSPDKCTFMLKYREQLAAFDKDEILARFEGLAKRLKERYPHLQKYEDLTFILCVHERTDRECSERHPIQEWFRDNGIEISEWQKEVQS